jgi:hypothetical protein
MINFDLSTLSETIKNAAIIYQRTNSPPAISDVAKISTINPIVVISSTVKTVDEKKLYNVLQTVLNIYAAYYMQAISILSAKLVSTKILKIMDTLHPDRDITTMLTATEGYKIQPKVESVSLEAVSLANKKYGLFSMEASATVISGDTLEEEEQVAGNSIGYVKNFDNLPFTVGKIINATFRISSEGTDKPAEVSIPVVVRLDTMVVPSETVSYLLTYNEEEIRFSERLSKALSGRIRFIKDFLLAQDLVQAQKKAMIKDPTGVYSAIIKRLNNSRIFSILTKNLSMSEISSIVVITDEEEKSIKRQYGAGLESNKIRKMVFDNLSAMMIVSIDRQWEQVSIYIKDQDSYAQNSISDFKVSSDKSNDSIVDILKAFSLGNPPSF